MRKNYGALLCKTNEEIEEVVRIAKTYGYVRESDVKLTAPEFVSLKIIDDVRYINYLGFADKLIRLKKARSALIGDLKTTYNPKIVRRFSEKNVKYIIGYLGLFRLRGIV